jgi:hypothetical protein
MILPHYSKPVQMSITSGMTKHFSPHVVDVTLKVMGAIKCVLWGVKSDIGSV